MKYGSTEIVPDATTGWEIADQGKVMTFYLRQGIQWQQNLGELTAQDVVNHYQRMAGNVDKPDGTGKYTTLWKGNFVQVSSIEAVDKYTVRFKFSKPDASFFRTVLIHRPGPFTKLEAIKSMGDNYQNVVPGTGPYQLVRWEKGVKQEMSKNPNYFIKGLPRLEKVEQIVVADDTVAEPSLRSGQLDADVLKMTNDEVIERLIKDPGNLKVLELKGPGAQFLYVNWTKPPFDNQKFRQALYYAVNWDSWVKDGLKGRATKTYGAIASSNLYYDEKCIKQYDYNPTLAKQLLAEAGFPNGQGLRPITYVASNTLGNPKFVDFSSPFWKDLGIPLDIKIITSAQATERRNKGDYDIYVQGGGNHVLDPAYQAVRYYHSANFPPGNNNSYYKGADDIIDRLVTSFDPADRAKAMCDFLRKTSEDVATIAYAQRHQQSILGSKVDYLGAFDENVGFGYWLLETYMKK